MFFFQIYRGRDNHYKFDNLEIDTEYVFRVCPVRITQSNGDLFGPYTSTVRHRISTPTNSSGSTLTAIQHDTVDGRSTVVGNSTMIPALGGGGGNLQIKGLLKKIGGKFTGIYTNRKRISDQDKAIMLALAFLFIAIFVAILLRNIANRYFATEK